MPGTLTFMTTATDVLPVRSAAAGSLVGLGIAGWPGTMSPHTACAYAGDLRQFTGWLAARGIDPEAVTPGITTARMVDLAATGQSVTTRADMRSTWPGDAYQLVDGAGSIDA